MCREQIFDLRICEGFLIRYNIFFDDIIPQIFQDCKHFKKLRTKFSAAGTLSATFDTVYDKPAD